MATRCTVMWASYSTDTLEDMDMKMGTKCTGRIT